MRRLLVLCLALVPTLAPTNADASATATVSPDARQDIVDLRTGQLHSHQQFIGWTEDGRAISRRMVCSEDGAAWCRASIDTLRLGQAEQQQVMFNNDGLDLVATPDNPKGPISTGEAMTFIREEAKALEDLGPLSPGESVEVPERIFGSIGGEPTTVYLRTSPDRTDEMALNLYISVRGPLGVSIDLEHMVNAPWRVGDEQVLDARVSPDGNAVWLAMHYTDGTMCWDGEDIELTIADRRRVRAQLANAAGMRAYRDGQLDQAYALFVEATDDDPDYAWGWFNRGAVESRRGDLSAAQQSLRTAVERDPALAERACEDDDYEALGATTEGAALMACGYEEGC